jgi:hypothetical protein
MSSPSVKDESGEEEDKDDAFAGMVFAVVVAVAVVVVVVDVVAPSVSTEL